jgi:hypothetical protein
MLTIVSRWLIMGFIVKASGGALVDVVLGVTTKESR